ncbi:MAG: hypothetical protein HOF20_06450 [Pelagibacteraceae bacterium]|jgi:hypothetical protein|nr:hypothetical protein [Pelagibacteraceae bacterium]MBT6354921.1 hypothetical protein [Pelagibacteraceae bacterium]
MRKPQFFPEDISGAIKKFNLEQKDYFIWTNKEGKGVFGIYINDNLKPDKLGRKRTAMPFCFIEGKWSESFGWKDVLDFKRPLYKEEELLTTDKDILVVSGSMTREAASKLYPNYFVTTFYGSSINWENHDWSVLRNKKVIFLPKVHRENDKEVINFEQIANYVAKTFSVSAAVIRVPSYQDIVQRFENDQLQYSKINWGIDDSHWTGFNPKSFIENTYVVEEADLRKAKDFDNIIEDVSNDRWIYLTGGDQYYDSFKRKFCKPKELDTLYLRDLNLVTHKPKVSATEFLQRVSIPFVDHITFAAGKPFIFSIGKSRYLNRYIPPSIREVEDDDYDISIFRDHILDTLCDGDRDSFNNIEDAIAWDLRNVGGNRKWMICLASEEGLGKDLFFKALTKFYGKHNCDQLMLEDIKARFRPFFVESCVLFLGEVDDTVVKDKSIKGYFKKIIADDVFRVEVYKNVDSVRVETCFTLWGSSNEAIPIRASKNQRRLHMVDSAVIPKDILANNPKYFDDLGEFIEDDEKIAQAYHYYKKVHKISESFTPHRCPATDNLNEIIEASKAEFMRYIDRIRREVPHEIDSFKYDLINVQKLTEELQKYSFEDDAWGGKNLKLDYNKVLRWVKQRPNRRVKNQAHCLPDSKGNKSDREGRLWLIDNHKEWMPYISSGGSFLNDTIDAHFFDGLRFGLKEKQEEKKRKEAS